MKEELKEGFIKNFNSNPEEYFQCGGRFEVLGNHTDHNLGLCIAGTCSLTTNAAVSKRDDLNVSIVSEGNKSCFIDLNDLEPKNDEKETTEALIRGTISYFKDHGYKYGGINVYCNSNIPIGAGLSSSAAFELLIGKIFNDLFNDGKIETIELSKAGHFAEREYFGKKCGLLDQIGVAFGGYTYIDFSSVEPKIESLKLDMTGFTFLSVNTGSSHADLSDLYSSIPNDMHNAANKMGYKNLVEGSEFELNLNKEKLTDMEYSRSLHFYQECERVIKAKTAIKNKDINELVNLMNESMKSSTELLKNMYVDKIEGSPLEACRIILEASNNQAGVKINGGGFGGSVIALVPDKVLEKVTLAVTERYGEKNVKFLKIRNKGPERI